jgi:hypothetical protein
MRREIAAAAGVVLLAACGSSAATAGPSSPAANTLACQHYLRQYHWKQNLAFPSMADAIKWETYVAADGAQAAPGTKLAHDLGQELLAMQGKKNTYKNGTVYKDCSS